VAETNPATKRLGFRSNANVMGSTLANSERFEEVRDAWRPIIELPVPAAGRFDQDKRDAHDLINAGQWTSGPADMLSVLGRQRDELAHSRLIGWLLVPTGRHGLGRSFLNAFLDGVWPGETLMRSGAITVETEVTGAALDEEGRVREARADIVLRGDGVTVLIENKLDAGEQPDQCERLFWAWAADPGDNRWLFLTPTGRAPVTATSAAARAAWRTMSYAQLCEVLESVLRQSSLSAGTGPATAVQYLTTLRGAVAR
jgi:hypothetical protein